MKPTNALTLGNLTGALKNWVELQKDYQCIFGAMDLHSITVPMDPKDLRSQSYFVIAAYIAGGVDTDRCTLMLQSQVPAHAELAWILNCYSSMGELSRMTQFKDKNAKEGTHIQAGIFNYPVLMAADVLLYQAHLVPVGADQKQHIELTRDLAIRINNLYQEPLFTVPEPHIGKVGSRIMDLQNPTAKMSKSESGAQGAIFLMDTDEEITKKVKRAVTDSGSEISYDDSKPGIQNLIQIQSALTGKSIDSIVASYAGKQYGHLKVEIAEIVVQAVRPIRTEITRLLTDLSYLDSLLKKGAEKASEQSGKTLKKVMDTVGFIPRLERSF